MREPTLLEILANKVEQTPELRSLVQTFSKVSGLKIIPKSAVLVKTGGSYEFSIAVNHKVVSLRKLLTVIGRMKRRVNKPYDAKLSVDKITKRMRISFKFEDFREMKKGEKSVSKKPSNRVKKS